jgi:hypothetical protein
VLAADNIVIKTSEIGYCMSESQKVAEKSVIEGKITFIFQVFKVISLSGLLVSVS